MLIYTDALHRRIQGALPVQNRWKELYVFSKAEWKKIPLAVIQRLIGKYAPEGSRCNCLSWRLYQLLIVNNVRFLFYHRCPNTYLVVSV
ncbi:hypothetical protein CEXT_108601 [Caerostris extrusa]|uniref:Uncharacterized protein n=1 Tax=Caerostris extrusa TaxID=172846 RepID=A0AAV4RRB1_CAEEX|nr:hypothetical protein CEXT_108601 [Caerostris extrusa]